MSNPEPHREVAARGFDERQWFCWRYNEVVGWIRLFALGHDQLRGEYYFVEAERLVSRPKHKTFHYQHNAFELWLQPKDSSRTIHRRVLRALENLQKEEPFRGRHIDLECFTTLGPLIRWRDLVNAKPAKR